MFEDRRETGRSINTQGGKRGGKREGVYRERNGENEPNTNKPEKTEPNVKTMFMNFGANLCFKKLFDDPFPKHVPKKQTSSQTCFHVTVFFIYTVTTTLADQRIWPAYCRLHWKGGRHIRSGVGMCWDTHKR